MVVCFVVFLGMGLDMKIIKHIAGGNFAYVFGGQCDKSFLIAILLAYGNRSSQRLDKKN